MIAKLEVTGCSQRDLVKFLKAVIADNAKLGIRLEVCIWNHAFAIFYRARNEYRDGFVCQLLGIMQSEGSEAKPDIDTFEVILHGIANNGGLQRPLELIDLVMDKIMSSHGTRNIYIWNSVFDTFYRAPNEYRDGFVCQLLGKMQSEGSAVRPDIDTFETSRNEVDIENLPWN